MQSRTRSSILVPKKAHIQLIYSGLKLTCLTFLTPVIVQCLRSDSSCFGHYNRSCLLTYLQLRIGTQY